jgi:cytochrome c-type biogenesis protein CcmH
MIWFALGLLALAAIVVVLPPLLKGAAAAPGAETDLAVYRDQLKEIDSDQERGLISATEADAARTEIKRRILALDAAPAAKATATRGARPLAIVVGIALIAVSGGLYLALGRPGLPASPYDPTAEQLAAREGMLREVDTMVAGLAARLKAQPNDPTGWRMLGWSYLQLGKVDDGVDALKKAVALDGKNAPLRSLLGEGLVRQADGKITPEALAAFDEALKLDAKEPRARFYKGLALMQAGKDQEALDAWNAIVRDGPPDAEWLPAVRDQAAALAAKLRLKEKGAAP